jgi:nucleoside-diphosphate-sugar epimerase
VASRHSLPEPSSNGGAIMSCRRHCGYRRLQHRPTRYWGILKWPSLGEFGWPPGCESYNRQYGTPRKLLNVDRLRALGWQPKTALRDRIAKAYTDFLTKSDH